MAVTIDEIYRTIRGYSPEELEALLVNSDDFHLLCQSLHSHYGSFYNPATNEIRFCGVKIIESSHVQKGTIYKVFKNQGGVGNNNTFTQDNFTYPSDLKQCVDEQASIQSEPLVVKKDEPEENRHSTTRKIELD